MSLFWCTYRIKFKQLTRLSYDLNLRHMTNSDYLQFCTCTIGAWKSYWKLEVEVKVHVRVHVHACDYMYM